MLEAVKLASSFLHPHTVLSLEVSHSQDLPLPVVLPLRLYENFSLVALLVSVSLFYKMTANYVPNRLVPR